jgi:tRNA(adenine34) deaminase
MIAAVDERWMAVALAQARAAGEAGEVPIGAAVVHEDTLLAAAGNASIAESDPSAHAEIRALRAAGRRLGAYRLAGTVLYVTVEPCAMCLGAALWARVERLVFGCHDPKAGAAGSVIDLTDDPRLNHRVRCTAGVGAAEAAVLLQEFFRARR